MLRFFVYLFILAGSIGFSLTMRAQHCGFDGVYLLGIVPYDQDSSDILSDLEITLVDGKGNLVKSRTPAICKQNNRRYHFYNRKPIPLNDLQYCFAKNHYVYVGMDLSYLTTDLFVKIESKKNGTRGYVPQLVRVSPQNFVHLCGYSEFFYSQQELHYKPIWVKMQKENIPSIDILEQGHAGIMPIIENVKGDDWIARRVVERNGWLFEKEWRWREVQSETHGNKNWVVQTFYRVIDIVTQKVLLEIEGEHYTRVNPNKLKHPEIRDVDFDGLPDLLVPIKTEKDYDFYGFNQENKRFMRLFISDLTDIKIDYVHQEIKGVYYEYGFPKTKPIAKVFYTMSGKGLTQVNTERKLLQREEKVTIPVKLPIWVKTKGSYRYELWDIDPKDQIALDAVPGAYAQKLMVFNVENNQLMYSHFITGNHYLEAGLERNFLLLNDFNKDGFWDIYVPQMHPAIKEKVILSEFKDSSLYFRAKVDFHYTDLFNRQWDEDFREFLDCNADSISDFRILESENQGRKIWKYYLFDASTNSYQYNLQFSMLDYFTANNADCIAWNSHKMDNGDLEVTYFKLANGELLPFRKSIQDKSNSVIIQEWINGIWSVVSL